MLMQATVSGARLAGNFWRAYIHFSLVKVAHLNSVLRANFGAYENQRRAAFYFSTEFLGCAECECFAGAVSHCNFVLCVATKLTWVGACIPPGLQNASLADCTAWHGNEEAMQKLDLQLIMLYLVLLICIHVPAFLNPIQSLPRLQRFSTAAARPTEHSLSQPQA